MDAFVAELRKIPPVTRFLCGSSLGIMVPLLMKLVNGYKVVYTYELVFQRMQVWRLYTSFFVGNGGINYIFDLVMLYRTANQLEEGTYSRRSADLAWQLLFACASIIAATTPLKSTTFFHPLLTCLVYLSSATAPLGTQTSLMGFFTIPITYLPYTLIGMDLLVGGPAYAAQAIAGAVVGHAWWWGVWGSEAGGRGGVLAEWAGAPEWMRGLVGEAGRPREPGLGQANEGPGGVHIVRPRTTLVPDAGAAPRSGPAAAGGSSGSGHNWGSGRTLGTS